MRQSILFAMAAAASLAACNQNSEPEVVGGIPDPMADELANAAPIDAASVPMMVASDNYRCTGSNALLQIDWLQTGDVNSARVTPAGAAGVNVTEQGAGNYTDGNNTLSGTPQSDTITFNGASCKR